MASGSRPCGEVHRRTTFARQAANLWKVKERPSGKISSRSLLTIRPSLSAIRCPCQRVCFRPRLPRCSSFKGEAAFGKEILLKQTFYYGLRMHVRGSAGLGLLAASRWLRPTPMSSACSQNSPWEPPDCDRVGDRNYYYSSNTRQELAGMGVELLAPYYYSKKRDPDPQRSAFLSRLR